MVIRGMLNMDTSKSAIEALIAFLLPQIREVITDDAGTIVINTSSYKVRANAPLMLRLFAAM